MKTKLMLAVAAAALAGAAQAQTVKTDDGTRTVQQCMYTAATTIQCDVTRMINNGASEPAAAGTHSIILPNGQQIRGSEARGAGNQNWTDLPIWPNYYPGIPLQIQVRFTDVPAGITKLSAVTVRGVAIPNVAVRQLGGAAPKPAASSSLSGRTAYVALADGPSAPKTIPSITLTGCTMNPLQPGESPVYTCKVK